MSRLPAIIRRLPLASTSEDPALFTCETGRGFRIVFGSQSFDVVPVDGLGQIPGLRIRVNEGELRVRPETTNVFLVERVK